MKISKKSLFILLGLLIALPAFARDFTYTYEGQTLTYTVIDEEAKTCETKAGVVNIYTGSHAGNNVSGTLVIPKKVSDGLSQYTVTMIGSAAFLGCSQLTSVVIPNSVSKIGFYAFRRCSSLKIITIGNSVTQIGHMAFNECDGLTKAEFASVESLCNINFVDIDSNPLYYAGNLYINGQEIKDLIIPGTVDSIKPYAFIGCSGLTSVSIPESVTYISDGAFSYCTGLKLMTVQSPEPPYCLDMGSDYANTVLDIPVGTLHKYAATRWGAFENIMENGVMSQTYNDGVFKYRLIPDDVTPKAVLMRGDYSSMEVISIPERFTDERDPNNPVRYTISAIGSSAFQGCTKLEEINFHSRSRITIIAPGAFYGCTGISEMAIPETVTSIGDYAFARCKYLTSVTIPNSVTIIGSHAFSECKYLTSVTIPNSVTIIGSHAFSECEYLTSVAIPELVTTISPFTFKNCSRLTSVAIPNSVSTIGAEAFYGCGGLTSVAIPNSVTTIGSEAFSGCRGLTSITIPNSVTSIGSHAFCECYYLTIAEFASIESLCNIDFADDTANPLYYADHLYIDGEEVTNLVIPDSVTSIGDFAFRGCSGITSVTIGNLVNTIGSNAFNGCYNLTSVTIGNSVNTIGNSAFKGCSGLTAVAFPNSVTTIGDYAFSDCGGLISLTIGNSVVSIGSGAFRNCYNLASVILGNSVSKIDYDDVFGGCPITNLNIADGYSHDVLFFEGEDVPLSDIEELYLGRNVYFGRMVGGEKFPSIKRLITGNTVVVLYESMFSGCTGLTEVVLGNGLKTILNNAFSGCSLKQVVLPPSVETIEASAFAGNTDLATIIMGHNVKTIGEKAYDGCAAQTIRITALTPPTAPNNTFSRYTGQLWVANAQAVEDYYNAYTCWDRFSSYAMIEPEEIKIEGAQTIDAVPGDTIRLTATISPENVTLPQIFWRSTNPDIATVDNDGVVVVRGVEPEISTYAQGDDDYTEGGCRIIAESLYADAPIAVVAINSELADIEGIIIDRKESQTIDYAEPYDVYNMQGVWLGRSADAVAPGFYILRQGSKAAKIMK